MNEIQTKGQTPATALEKKPASPQPPDTGAQADLAFPKEWTLFGPLAKDDPEPDFAAIKELPTSLGVAGKNLEPLPAVFTDHRLDLGALLGGKEVGKTAYLLATIDAAKEGEVVLGAGADWWMKWWVNGEMVYDTTAAGNGKHPPQATDHRFTARLKAGRNLIAVKVASGNGGFVLAVDAPREASAWLARQKARLGEPIRYINPKIPRFDLPENKGEYYEARVPDTLDLHERAALAINGLTGCVDPGADYEIYWRVDIKGDRPVMFRDINHQVQLIMQRAVPLMRRMSGSTEKRDVERRWLEVLLHLRGPDNLFYYPLQGRPWIVYYKDAAGQYDDFQGDQYTGPLNNGWTLELLGLYYRLTGDPQFKEMGEKLTDAMIAHFVHRDDYAFEPKGNYGLGEKPPSDSPIPENWFKNALMGWPAYCAVQFYRATGYRPALEFSGKLARFTWKRSGMFDADGRWLATRHGAWHTAPLFGILEYALEAGDREMIDFVRKSYEYAKAPGQHMDLLTGFTPENAEATGQTGEICEVAFMLNLAIKLSAAGVGDYWDDADRWTRNHFAEGQLTRSEWMNRIAAGPPGQLIDPVHESDENVACKCLGAFAGWPHLNDFHGGSSYFGPGSIFMHCCVGEGSAALYRVWEHILTHAGGRLKVNLLLNRASPWADIASHIPYRGQVDVKMKQDLDLEMRLAEWVQPADARCTVDGQPRKLTFKGRYAQIGPVKAGQAVTLTFPISERTDKVLVQGNQYTLIRRGNDVVHIDPPGKNRPLYQRGHYRQGETLWTNVRRFVPAQEIPW